MTPEETLALWNEEREAVVARMLAGGGKPGLARPEMVAGKTGLEVMQAMLAGTLPFPHIADTLDFSLVEVAPGKAVFQGTPQLKHYNPLGTVHGGWYATLLDSALGCAVHTMMPAGRGYTTAELGVNIVRAASESESFSVLNGRTGRAEVFDNFIGTSICHAVNARDQR